VAIIRSDLLELLLEFRRERDWEKFHTPRNLSAALAVEAAELSECFQWAHDGELEELVVLRRTAIENEIADIAILLSYLCHDIGIELDAAVQSKIEQNREKYPPHLARGNATKYDRL
jgi:dCTP diphosphatase